jgi:hypothetical protein
MGGFSKNKSYVGYKPKSNNLVKLAHYLTVNSRINDVTSTISNDIMKYAPKINSVLKHKKFK